jgi:hypothetical protein
MPAHINQQAVVAEKIGAQDWGLDIGDREYPSERSS